MKIHPPEEISDDLAFFEEFRKDLYFPEAQYEGLFGRKVNVIYADATAMGSPVRSIEKEVRKLLKKNDMDELNRVYNDSLRRIASSFNLDDSYQIIPVGSGCTGAMNLLFRDILGWRLPDYLSPVVSPDKIPEAERPVLITTLMEHHSSDLVLRESFASKVVHLCMDADGLPDSDELDKLLQYYRNERNKTVWVVCSAGSNITGIAPDIEKIRKIVHKHHAALAADYAAAAPYESINMKNLQLDALALSPHKFPGGPQTCGLLILRKKHLGHYRKILNNRKVRPAEKIEIFRTALVLDLKKKMNPERIRNVIKFYTKTALDRLALNKKIELLGAVERPRFCIISFLVKYEIDKNSELPQSLMPYLLKRNPADGLKKYFVHHNLIARLLSDLYGIQVRPGCSCAGPYGHWLLDIDEEMSLYHRNRIDRGLLDLKPGWVRMTLNELISLEEAERILNAVDELSEEWVRYAAHYRQNPETGEFHPKAEKRTLPVLRTDLDGERENDQRFMLTEVEDYIETNILQYAANTHTETSYTGTVMTNFYRQAQDAIRDALGADDSYALKFIRTGYDCFDALSFYLGVRVQEEKAEKFGLKDRLTLQDRTVFFLFGQDWRETFFSPVAEIVRHVNRVSLLKAMEECRGRPGYVIFRPDKNATEEQFLDMLGKMQEYDYGIIVEATPVLDEFPLKTAENRINGIILYPDELPGGLFTHPVLLLQEGMFKNKLPLDVGGGIVNWTTAGDQRYVKDRTIMEDAGTPGIIQALRTAIIISGTSKSED